MKYERISFREAGVGGSNPLAPTNNSKNLPEVLGQSAAGEKNPAAHIESAQIARQQHPDYHQGFADAVDLTPLHYGMSSEYRSGWMAAHRCRRLLRCPPLGPSAGEACV